MWVLTACCSILLTFAIAYPMAYAHREDNPTLTPLDKTCINGVPDIFLSSSIAYPNGQLVGAFGLSMGGIAMMMVIYLRHLFVEKKITGPAEMVDPCPRWCCCGCTKANDASFWIGIIATIGMIGVGAFPCSQIPELHYLSAITAFGLYNAYIIIQTFVIDKDLREVDGLEKYPCRHWLRVVFTILAVGCATMMFALGFGSDGGKDDTSGEKGGSAVLTSIFEIGQVVFFELWILTLFGSFKSKEEGGEAFTVTMTMGDGLQEASKKVGTARAAHDEL